MEKSIRQIWVKVCCFIEKVLIADDMCINRRNCKYMYSKLKFLLSFDHTKCVLIVFLISLFNLLGPPKGFGEMKKKGICFRYKENIA